jgi:penicillin-binding protein 1A
LVSWALLARNLPDAETLLDYEPPLPSVVRGYDGEIVHSYARERRVQLQFKDFPAQLVNSYTSAFLDPRRRRYHRHAQRRVRLRD